MYLLDVNVLMAAHRADHPQHEVVRAWLTTVASDARGFSIPEVVHAAFVRITTNRRIFEVPTPIEEALEFLDSLRRREEHLPLALGPRGFEVFRDICLEHRATGDLIPDVHLVSLAFEHGCTIASLDRDFARFSEIEWVDPSHEAR